MRILTLTLMAFLTLHTPAHADNTRYDEIVKTGIIRCGYTPWPNFFERDAKTNVLKGFYKDLVDRVMAGMHWKVEYVEVTLGQQVDDLKSGKIDAMCGEGPWLIDSAKFLNYSAPVNYMPVYVYGRIDAKAGSLSALNETSVKFVGIDGDLSIQLVENLFARAHLDTISNMSDGGTLLMSVATRKADYAVVDSLAAAAYDKSNPGQIKRIAGQTPLAVYPIGFATLKQNKDLLDTLNAAVQYAHNTHALDSLNKAFDPGNTLIIQAPSLLNPLN